MLCLLANISSLLLAVKSKLSVGYKSSSNSSSSSSISEAGNSSCSSKASSPQLSAPGWSHCANLPPRLQHLANPYMWGVVTIKPLSVDALISICVHDMSWQCVSSCSQCRALWVGNIDNGSITEEMLIKLFARWVKWLCSHCVTSCDHILVTVLTLWHHVITYWWQCWYSLIRCGQVESIRMLPARFCAFVNFKEPESAARALKELQVCLVSWLLLALTTCYSTHSDRWLLLKHLLQHQPPVRVCTVLRVLSWSQPHSVYKWIHWLWFWYCGFCVCACVCGYCIALLFAAGC